jgi:hypothetical protein
MSNPQNPLSPLRRRYEERQRFAARLEALAERLRADEQRVRAEIQRVFADWLAPEDAAGKPVCARTLIERHGKLARTLASVERRIAAASDALAGAARELKEHERAAPRNSGSAVLSGQPAIFSPGARPTAPPNAGLDRGE